MNEEEILSILNKYTYKYYSNDKHSVVSSDRFNIIVEEIVMKTILAKSELEAKVYTYEKIINNSNFKSVLSKDKQTLEKKIKELEKQVKELESNNE